MLVNSYSLNLKLYNIFWQLNGTAVSEVNKTRWIFFGNLCWRKVNFVCLRLTYGCVYLKQTKISIIIFNVLHHNSVTVMSFVSIIIYQRETCTVRASRLHLYEQENKGLDQQIDFLPYLLQVNVPKLSPKQQYHCKCSLQVHFVAGEKTACQMMIHQFGLPHCSSEVWHFHWGTVLKDVGADTDTRLCRFRRTRGSG